jgi:hypothetical protein
MEHPMNLLSPPRAVVAALALALAAAAPAPAQPKGPRPSPKASVMQAVGTAEVTITYSRPGVKGRVIWGGLVPWDKVWRAGANEATTFAVTQDVTIDGQKLPAGTYSLHAIPGKAEWTVIFNKDAKQWGSFNYKEADDALRIKVKPETGEMTEWLTYSITPAGPYAATVALAWEKLRVPFTVRTGEAPGSLPK